MGFSRDIMDKLNIHGKPFDFNDVIDRLSLKINKDYGVSTFSDLSKKVKHVTVPGEFYTDNEGNKHKVVITSPENWSDSASIIFYKKYTYKGTHTAPALLYTFGSNFLNKIRNVILEKFDKNPYPLRALSLRDLGYIFDGESFEYIALPYEKSIDVSIFRLCLTWALSAYLEERICFSQVFDFTLVCFFLIREQAFSPNSPQWFNLGLLNFYGISGGDRVYSVFDSKSRDGRDDISIWETDSFVTPQLHACFILPSEDNLCHTENSIMDHLKRESSIFKYGSGSGSNYSKIRPKGSPISKGGKSSGLMSFLKVGDASAGAIKSGGTTRRSARMLFLDSDHKDVDEFISWKRKEEDKVACLVEGYKYIKNKLNSGDYKDLPSQVVERYKEFGSMDELDYHWEGNAYQTVSGQNGNNTILIKDTHKSLSSGQLSLIARNAWACGDPGVAFDECIQKADTMPELNDSGYKIHCTNPCGEFVWRDNTACNLASINVDKAIPIDLSLISSLITNILDLCINIAGYPSEDIARMTVLTRPLGLGITNLACYTAKQLGNKDNYGSKDMCSLSEAIISCVKYSAIIASCYITKNARRSDMNDAVTSFRNKLYKGKENNPGVRGYFSNISELLSEISGVEEVTGVSIGGGVVVSNMKESLKAMNDLNCYPNNGQLTAIAPTGTISLIMDCETTGIEPYYSRKVYKTLAGGGIYEAESRLAIGNCVEDGIDVDRHLNVLKCIQSHVCGGVSKTVNLPNKATVEEVEDVLLDAYNMGIKCITVFRDGCKCSQPLNDKGISNKKECIEECIEENKSLRKKLPNVRKGTTIKSKIAGNSIYVRTGDYEDGSLGEIFIDMHKEGATMRAILSSFAMAVSIGLQHGVPLDTFIKAFVGTKFEPNGVVVGHEGIKITSSIVDYIFRDLGYRYLSDDSLLNVHKKDDNNYSDAVIKEVSKKNEDFCEFCGNYSVITTGTCKVCTFCGENYGGCG